MGAYVNRGTFGLRLRGRPLIDYNEIVQAEIINGFVGDYPLGLFGFNGCEHAAVGEGYGIISADHIRIHNQQILIYQMGKQTGRHYDHKTRR